MVINLAYDWKNFPASQTNSAHKHSQPGSQITEPISAWKVYFRWLPGENYPRNLQSTPGVTKQSNEVTSNE